MLFFFWRQLRMNFDAIIVTHQLGGNTEHQMGWKGGPVTIHDQSRKIVRIGVPRVIILADESTPQRLLLHSEAGTNFENAARRLVDEGVEFYTFLRPDWAIPALLWTIALKK